MWFKWVYLALTILSVAGRIKLIGKPLVRTKADAVGGLIFEGLLCLGVFWYCR